MRYFLARLDEIITSLPGGTDSACSERTKKCANLGRNLPCRKSCLDFAPQHDIREEGSEGVRSDWLADGFKKLPVKI